MIDKKKEIDDFCTLYEIENYTINKDMSVDVDGYVDLDSSYYKYNISKRPTRMDKHKLKKLPFKFNIVTRDFSCNGNELDSFENFPNIVGGCLSVGHNKFYTFDNLPIRLHSLIYNYCCYKNPIFEIINKLIANGDRLKNLEMFFEADPIRPPENEGDKPVLYYERVIAYLQWINKPEPTPYHLKKFRECYNVMKPRKKRVPKSV